MEMDKKMKYEAPEVEVLLSMVEIGFAGSGDGDFGDGDGKFGSPD